MPIKKSSAPAADAYVDDSASDLFEAEDPNEQSARSSSLQKGWGAAKEMLKGVGGDSKFSYNFKFGHAPELIAFIEGEPIDSFKQHWVTRSGQQSFRCLEERCPLCAAGNVPSAKFTFFILHFVINGDDINPEPKIMTVGPKVLRQLSDIDEDPRKGGPLLGRFFAVSKTGEKQQTQYIFTPVKSRDIPEDWGFSAEDANSEVVSAQRTAEPNVYTPRLEDLEAVAAEIR